jgi:hypothetical protein
MPMERIVVLDDGTSFGGPNLVMDVDLSLIDDEAAEDYESSKINGVVTAVENSHGKIGRILDINALVELFDAIDVCGDGLPPAVWEAYNKCLHSPRSTSSDSPKPTDC